MNGNVFIFICLETWKLGLFGPLCYECGYVHVCPVCEHMCVSVKVLLAGIRTFFFFLASGDRTRKIYISIPPDSSMA